MIKKAVNPHFKAFLTDWASTYYLLVGGYGSSKSYHIALKILCKLLTERRTCLVVREVFETIRDSCYSLFMEISEGLELSELVTFTRSPMQINFANGSKVIFKGLDKPAKLKSINDVSLIWIEECSEISYDGFKELVGRLRHPKLKLHMILSTNPISKSNWVYEHFFIKREVDDEELYRARVIRVHDTYYHHSTADDNLFLSPKSLENLTEMQSYDPDRYRVARLGRFGANGMRVLPNFEVASHAEVMAAVEAIPIRRRYVGLDFGFAESYNAVVRVAVDHERRMLILYWEYYRNHETDDELADNLIEAGFARTHEIVRCDSAEPKAIKFLQKCGINAVAARKWNGGSRHARLDNLRKVKRFRKIICSDICANCIRELADLTFKKDKDGHIIPDAFNLDAHTLSAIWYALDTYDLKDVKSLLSKADFGF